MRLSLLPSELLGFLLASSILPYRIALASSVVNVALQASFNASPYILELLFVTSTYSTYWVADPSVEKLPLKRIRLHTSPSLTASRKAASRIVQRTKSCTQHFCKYWKMMDISRSPTSCLPSNWLFRYTQQHPGSKLITTTTTPQ